MRQTSVLLLLAVLVSLILPGQVVHSDEQEMVATAYALPFETAPDGEGYFAIVQGHDGRLYIGTHANALNSWLVAFDPAAKTMTPVVDVMKTIGHNGSGFMAQAKIHTRNNVGASGRIYFATKQGYPAKGELRIAYPGGYPMVYDPATKQTAVYPIPIAHQGIISITPDESRGLAYISTCSDGRPFDNTHFLVLDLETQQYTDLGDMEHLYAFIVVDHLGRAYHPIRGGQIARYNPDTRQLDRLPQTIDGKAPSPDSHLADENAHPINWDISADRKTLYSVPMSTNQLYAYDLTAKGDTIPGRALGELIPGEAKTDCRALAVGPTGTVWAAVTIPGKKGRRPYLVRYRPGQDDAPVNMGMITIDNPDFTDFKGPDGKLKPYHHGFIQLDSGQTINKNVFLGICQSKAGDVYVLALSPYSVLKIQAEQLR